MELFSKSISRLNWSQQIRLQVLDHLVSIFVVHSCSMPLGVEDMRISDSAFTASGSYNSNHRPSLARLNLLSDGKHIAAWCPKAKSTNQWLQINLGEITAVTKVATQGRYNSEDRVKTYKLSYSVDGIHWTWYKQRAVDKVTRETPNVMGLRRAKSIPAVNE